jgi:hypothetical protein
LEDLIGDDIIEVCFQSCQIGLDLSAKTQAGRVLEIFSDFPYGEWTLSIWSPDDERRIPIFDLEGPVATDLD